MTAMQSSTFRTDEASRAVDGNITNNVLGQTCSSTNVNDAKPWWMVDLGQTLYVEEVVVVNRGDCCGNRLHNFSIEVLANQSDPSPSLCYYQESPIVTGFTKRFPCPQDLSGQYVRIRKHGINEPKDILTLCEVEVFGSRKASGGCPSDFSLIYSRCYRFSHFEENWLDARSHCKTTPGADLAVFSSRGEDVAVSKYLMDSHHGDTFYLGVIDYNVLEEKTFVCETMKKLTYTNWAPIAEKPRCLSINRGTNFTWHSSPCHEKHFFICEISPQ
ncbi:uncharacterized protein LOC121384642 [Gigantopelta aegis]|uniref:uncharacterized protein LOC121384642 n=1 Tax=Gigantopelta aegis TaxID=1735272 RepID=UPI001B88A0AC|nr:uncharacterized protein LOC121384642 [Gigantopelta aegis]